MPTLQSNEYSDKCKDGNLTLPREGLVIIYVGSITQDGEQCVGQSVLPIPNAFVRVMYDKFSERNGVQYPGFGLNRNEL